MSNDVKFLFLGGLFPKETEKEILDNSIHAVQNAANVLQWSIVTGLDENLEEPVDILNSLYIGSWPRRYKKLFIPTYSFKHSDDADDLNVGFCNLCGYKIFSRQHTLNRELKKWIKNTTQKKVILAYAMTDVMINALYKAKRLDKNVVTCLIVPDLPQFMNMSSKFSVLHTVFKNLDIKFQKSRLPYIDNFVFLTEQMNTFFQVKNYTVVEGVAGDFYSEIQAAEKREKTVLYTGGLNSKYGIVNLVNAFMQIEDPGYRLILCGSGDAVPYIQEAQKKDTRIEYRGLLPHQDILSLQAAATVLVNPRQNTEEFTKYSFPSKTMEYMLSGNPVVMYKLDGIPEEYHPYLNYVPDNSIEALRDTIVEICSLSNEEREQMGQKAREFLLKEKNKVKQARKILQLCSHT